MSSANHNVFRTAANALKHWVHRMLPGPMIASVYDFLFLINHHQQQAARTLSIRVPSVEMGPINRSAPSYCLTCFSFSLSFRRISMPHVREKDNVTDGIAVSQEHRQAVDTYPQSASGRHPILQRSHKIFIHHMGL